MGPTVYINTDSDPRLYLIGIVEYPKAWLVEDRKLCGDDFDKLFELARVKARSEGWISIG
jgi:hypothetical protein